MGFLDAPAGAASVAGKANTADVVPKWKTATAYLAGTQVISPGGDVVSAKADHTSGASFTPANWTNSTTFMTANPALTVTYNTDGSVASTVENGVTTTFTYNTDGTVNTQTRAGTTRTFTYDASGNVTGAA